MAASAPRISSLPKPVLYSARSRTVRPVPLISNTQSSPSAETRLARQMVSAFSFLWSSGTGQLQLPV